MEPLQADDPAWIGRYRLLGKLGSGGMGMVYLAESPGGRLMAVKLIRPELAQNETFRDRFAREVEAARMVGGVFTAPVVDADLTGPAPWLVTAYVDGPGLDAAVQQRGPLPAESLLALAAGLAEGLSAIHAAGLVHRDLKPANVLLASDGPRIIDFGVSRALDGTGLTSTGLILGTPGFMSPEQAEGGRVGPASDIFSLGSVLAFAATGDGPFGSGSTPALLYRVVHGASSTDGLPAEIRPLVEACLQKDPSRRPTADQILAQVSAMRPAAGWLPGTEAAGYQQTQAVVEAPAAPPSTFAPPPESGYRSGSGPGFESGSGSGYDRPWPQAAPAQAGYDQGWGTPGGQSGQLPPSPAPRRRRLGWLWAAVAALVLLAGGGAFALIGLAGASNGQANGPASGSSSTPAASSNPAAVIAVRSPARVVHAYFAAINSRDWPRVWRISHRALHETYRQMVAGYQNTARDLVTVFVARGDAVVARVRAYEISGPVQVYAFRFMVRDGVMTFARQTLLRTFR